MVLLILCITDFSRNFIILIHLILNTDNIKFEYIITSRRTVVSYLDFPVNAVIYI